MGVRLIAKSQHSFMVAIEKTYGRALRRFMSSRMRRATAADAPDLVQEVFLRLLRIDDHDAIRNPQAYLYTIAGHVLHQYNLREAVHPEPMDPLTIAAEFDALASADPAEEIEIEQRFEKIGRALEQVSPRAYATLVMYRCEGATLEQIGARFGVTRVMAKKYLTKAITYCQQRLEDTE